MIKEDGFAIEVVQGADFRWPVYYQDPDGNPIDLTGYTAKMQIRETPFAEDPPFVECNISITPSTGLILISITNTITSALGAPLKAVYDLFITSPAGEKLRLLWGEVNIIERVTK